MIRPSRHDREARGPRFVTPEIIANAIGVLLGLAGAAWFCSYFLKGGM